MVASVLAHLLMIGSLVHEMTTCTLHKGATSGIASLAGLFGGIALVLAGWYSSPLTQQILKDLHALAIWTEDSRSEKNTSAAPWHTITPHRCRRVHFPLHCCNRASRRARHGRLH